MENTKAKKYFVSLLDCMKNMGTGKVVHARGEEIIFEEILDGGRVIGLSHTCESCKPVVFKVMMGTWHKKFTITRILE